MKNGKLIKELTTLGYLKVSSVYDAFTHVDRIHFISGEAKQDAHHNLPIAINDTEVTSQPVIVAFLLELLEAKTGEKILEIGTGSGWQTALLAHIVAKKSKQIATVGSVISIERLPTLAEEAIKHIEQYHFISDGIVKIIVGDGSGGHEGEAPYDKIISSVRCESIPKKWKEQLRIGGRIVAPVRESIVVIDKRGPELFSKRQYFGYSFSPIISEQ